MNGDPQYTLLPLDTLIAKLTALASEPDATGLDDSAFWVESGELVHCLRDGMEALMRLAKDEEIGWDLNAGYRCDIGFSLYHVTACCQRERFGDGDDGFHAEIQAATPQGALAGAMLAIFQARLAKRTKLAA